MNEVQQPLVVSVIQAGQILGISRNHAYKGVREGWLPSIKLGNRFVVPRQALEAMVASATAKQAQPA